MGLFKDIHFCFGNGNSRKELDVDKSLEKNDSEDQKMFLKRIKKVKRTGKKVQNQKII